MTGLELSRRYWEEIGKPAFQNACPEVLERAAVGLVGEGSECFGFDDEISRDHDWGPGFCLWLNPEDLQNFGAAAQEVYAALPGEFLGFSRLRVCAESAHRVGVQPNPGFYARYLGFDRLPATTREWRYVPEKGLAVVTNGEVWQDPDGAFTRFRDGLLAYFPEELRRKKLANACALAAQSGQYNYARCLRRNETVAAFTALGEFVIQAQKAVFLLNRRYIPYYKWTHRALGQLPILGRELAPELKRLADEPEGRIARIEGISAAIIGELHRQCLTLSDSDFLLDHGAELQARLTDPELVRIPLMAE